MVKKIKKILIENKLDDNAIFILATEMMMLAVEISDKLAPSKKWGLTQKRMVSRSLHSLFTNKIRETLKKIENGEYERKPSKPKGDKGKKG